MQIPILTRSGVHDFFTEVSENIDRYREDGFSADGLNESLKDIGGTTIDLDAFATLHASSGSLSAGKADALNAHAVYNALEGMTPYLAQDERIWAQLLTFMRPSMFGRDGSKRRTSSRSHLSHRVKAPASILRSRLSRQLNSTILLG